MFRPPVPSSGCAVGSEIRIYICGRIFGFGGKGDDEISSYNSTCTMSRYYALWISIVWVNYDNTVLVDYGDSEVYYSIL
jgi:hypothetical protein